MEQLIIRGKKPLRGEVQISGAKNAAVAIIPAALCADGVCVIENLPLIEDVTCLIGAMTHLGVICSRLDDHTLRIDTRNVHSTRAVSESIRKMRASYYIAGALLGRFKKVECALPGGCNFGSRPIDLHIKGFEALGATVKLEHGVLKAEADKLIGTTIYLDVASVGATINLMLAAVYAEGTTTIENAAKEPHIVDTANFLNMLGANVKGAGTDVIRIVGVETLGGCEYTIIPDQIEAGTYMIAAAASGGDVLVKNLIPKHMDSLSAKLSEMNCEITENDDSIRVRADRALAGVNVKTMYYPGFPTDLQPQMSALLSTAGGTSLVTEAVFDNRFQYVNELKRLGAQVTVDGRMAVIEGPSELTGAQVTATDLRAGASLVIAALAAEGETVIDNVKYIDRGYENIVSKLQGLGADISRRTVDDDPDELEADAAVLNNVIRLEGLA